MEDPNKQDGRGIMAGKILMLEQEGVDVSPTKIQDKKRARKDGDSYVTKVNALATYSFEDGRRAQ